MTDWRRRLGLTVPPALIVLLVVVTITAEQLERRGYGDALQVNPEDDGMVEVEGRDGKVYRVETWNAPEKPNNWVPYGIAVGVGIVIAGVGSAVAWTMAAPNRS